MKARFQTVRVAVGDFSYDVIARVLPARRAPHVGADSPRFMSPDQPARIQVLRILRGAEEAENIMPWSRAKIEEAVREKLKIS